MKSKSLVLILILSALNVIAAQEFQELQQFLKDSNEDYLQQCLGVKVTTDHGERTLDCLSIIQDIDPEDQKQKYFGVFHTIQVGPEGYSQLYLAQKENSILDCEGWEVVTILSYRGSQGYLLQDNQKIYLGYERENHLGNYIAIRQFRGINELKWNSSDWEYQLDHHMRLANGTQTVVQNLGTPSIEKVDLQQGVIHFRYHFFPPGGPNDQPARATLNMLPQHYNQKKSFWQKLKSHFIKETEVEAIDNVYYNYSNWNGEQDMIVERAIQAAGGIGKIGQRDRFLYKNKRYYLYEAQLSDDPDPESDIRWQSWRVFLFDEESGSARLLQLEQHNDVNFANPHAKVIGNTLVLTNFVFWDLVNNGTYTGSNLRVIRYTQ